MVFEEMKYSVTYGISFDTNTILISGELNDEIGTDLKIKYNLLKIWNKNLKKDPLKEINLEISSYGGSIYSIFSAFDFFYELKQEGVLVNTKAHGICMSAATVLLAGATGKRYSYPNVRFMLHDVQIEGVGGTANQVQHTAKTISDEQMQLFAMYAKFSNKGAVEFTEKELLREAKKWHKKYTKDGVDHYLTPEEILKINLIDEIL